jgi:hypothetical protein
MCGICSRRALISGAIATAALWPLGATSGLQNSDAIPCACSEDEFANRHRTKTSKSGDDKFDAALIEELKVIEQIIPGINPGFQFVKAHNAFTTAETIIRGTQGTVWIGIDFVRNLVDPNNSNGNGGIAVAGVLAHECAHVFQLASADLLKRLVKDKNNAVLAELHADFLAGYYLARKRNVTPELLTVMQRVFVYQGAYNRSDPNYHGTPGLRGAAMDTGYFAAQDGKDFAQASEIGARYVSGLV